MLEISDLAVEKMVAIQENDEDKRPVRISLVSGASTGPNLGLVCDDKNDTDRTFKYDDLEVIIDANMLEYCKKITIDFVQNDMAGCAADGGFKITPEVKL